MGTASIGQLQALRRGLDARRRVGALTFIVYSRRGCHLCELLLGEIEPLVRGKAAIAVRDVDERPEWREAYGERVPVVCCDGDEICQYNLDRRAVLERIAVRGQ